MNWWRMSGCILLGMIVLIAAILITAPLLMGDP
jgi:hypothetical protein